MILTDEQNEMIKQLAESLCIVFQRIKRAIENLCIGICETFDSLKDLIKKYEDHSSIVDKPNWNTPQKILIKSQVFNRKPLMARARSNC